jgi:hypothetical protein
MQGFLTLLCTKERVNSTLEFQWWRYKSEYWQKYEYEEIHHLVILSGINFIGFHRMDREYATL